MSFSVRPLMQDDQGKLRILDRLDLRHARERHLLPVALPEFGAVGADMPIAFVKNSQTNQFQSVAVTGLVPGENLFIQDDQWLTPFVPRILAVYPFTLIPHEVDGQTSHFLVGIDENSSLFSQTEGELLMTPEGEESEYLQRRKQHLLDHQRATLATQKFEETLTRLELLIEQGINVQVGDKEQRLNGLYIVDEKKLNALSDAALLELQRQGFLSAIHAHLFSLHQFARLAQRKSRRLN